MSSAADPMVDRLRGEWRGSGSGEYRGSAFDFEEFVEFSTLAGPALRYQLRATDAETGRLIHTETGIWLVDDEKVTISVALPNAVEISEGEVSGDAIRLESTAVSVAASVGTPHLVSTARLYRCDGVTLAYDIEIAMSDTDSTRHVWARLSRAPRSAS